MRPFTLFAKVIIPVCLLVSIPSGLLTAQSTGRIVGPSAEVHLQPNLGGDVALYVATRDMPVRFDVPAFAPQLLGCDWTSGTSAAEYAGGICRGLIKADRGTLDGWVHLAPLVLALRKAGAARVDLRVTLYFWPGQRLETLEPWKVTEESDQVSYQFSSRSAGDLPLPLHIRLVNHPTPPRPLIPVLLLLTVPGAGGRAVPFGDRRGSEHAGAGGCRSQLFEYQAALDFLFHLLRDNERRLPRRSFHLRLCAAGPG